MLSAFPSTLPSIDVPMPLLRHLELNPKGNSGFEYKFRDAPKLRTVILHEFVGMTAILPWEQLTCLTMEVETSQWVSILPQTTNLVHCDVLLFCFGPHGIDDDPGSHLTLPFLESFVFKAIPEDKGTRFLNTLTVPALRSLEVQEQCIGPEPIRYLTSFIAKSRCRLQILDIRGKRTVAESSYRLAFPSIPELAFNSSFLGLTEEEDWESDEEDVSEGGEDDSESDEEDFAVEGESGVSDSNSD
ncbi:hypothetical protein B0H12DRAFT_1111023 [Mycena haematopus]|nr:hypothetical protein B0H12DRAFT_1111023 [Mycena haematopus]